MKDVVFMGGADEALRSFPPPARQRAGYQLYRVQSGAEPADWKPMATIGPGCREIRVRDDSGAYRVLYVATSAMPSTSCTASRRRPSARPRPTSTSERPATRPCEH